MSQDPPRRDTERDDRTLAGGSGGFPRSDETFIGGIETSSPARDPDDSGTTIHHGPPPAGPFASEPVAVGAASALAAEQPVAPCPGCGQIPEHASRYCQNCGRDLVTGSDGQARQSEAGERTRPWLIVFGLFWALVMVAALYFIYANAFLIGSS